jgi:hypothetical protein
MLEGLGDDYFHFRPDDANHVAVPVDPSEIAVHHRCDFCDIEAVEAIVLAETFTMPLPGPPSRSIGNWAACAPCAELVARRHWTALVSRVRRVGPRATRAFPRREILTVYECLARHMYGMISLDEWLARIDQWIEP